MGRDCVCKVQVVKLWKNGQRRAEIEVGGPRKLAVVLNGVSSSALTLEDSGRSGVQGVALAPEDSVGVKYREQYWPLNSGTAEFRTQD